jgi:hypothetical protein
MGTIVIIIEITEIVVIVVIIVIIVNSYSLNNLPCEKTVISLCRAIQSRRLVSPACLAEIE